MRNTINTRTNVVVFGNRQGRVVVAGTDQLRALADAHRLVLRHSATSLALSLPKSASGPRAKPTAAMRRAACAPRAAACYAGYGERGAGIPARQQCWQRTHRLPQAAPSRS
jgi:hypothetical protein